MALTTVHNSDFEFVEYLTYASNLVLSHFNLFTKMKNELSGQHFAMNCHLCGKDVFEGQRLNVNKERVCKLCDYRINHEKFQEYHA